jgi:hypothetical protein
MKTLKVTSLAIVLTIIFPLFIGMIQLNNTIVVVQNLTDKSDADIENTLRTFGFNNAWDENPTISNVWVVGVTTITQL